MNFFVSLTCLVLVFSQMNIILCFGDASDTELDGSRPVRTILHMAGRRIGEMWRSFRSNYLTGDSFIGRCLGAAKGLKVAMPLIIFKLGVILTIVAFLAVFALKGLGLLITLLILNVGGFFSKLALLKHDEPKHIAPPQTVHFHVHNKKGQEEYYHHPSYGGDGGWSDKSAMNQYDREELYNLYKRLGISKISDELGSYNTNNYNMYSS